MKTIKHLSYIFLAIVLSSCSPGVSKADITRACTIIGNTPQYIVESTFANEYYKLEDLAGRKSSADSFLLELKLTNMKLGVMSGQYYSFQNACESKLEEDFLN